MSEQNPEVKAVVDVQPTEPEADRPMMLYKVLLQEYDALDLIDDRAVWGGMAYKKERDEHHGVLHISERNKLPVAKRAEQLELAQKARSEVLERVREVLHRSGTRRIDAIFAEYKAAFMAETPGATEAKADV